MTELCDLTATEARRRIGSKEISPVELLESCIARTEAVNPAVLDVGDDVGRQPVAVGLEARRVGGQVVDAPERPETIPGTGEIRVVRIEGTEHRTQLADDR